MRLILHPDPHTLETELLRLVAGAKREDPLSPVLVLVPTLRLARHVERRMAERLGAVAATEVLTYRGAARRIFRVAGVSIPDPAEPRLLEGLLDLVLRRHAGGEIAPFVRRRPAALGSLLQSLRELREAGIAPQALADAGAADLAALHGAYVSALEARLPSGFRDEAAWIGEAAGRAEDAAARWPVILHHGAYELVGMHLDLLVALDRGSEITWLAPVAPGTRATEYAEAFFRRQLPGLLGKAHVPETGAAASAGDRLRSLYDEDAALPPLPGADSFLQVANFQGPEAEVEFSLRGALARAAAGTPPSEIAVLARSLEPYAAAIESVAARDGTPVAARVPASLRREPAPRDFLFLLRAVVDDFPRGPTAELLRSSHLRWPIGEEEVPILQRAEAWSRSAGIVGGLDSWERDLAAWALDDERRSGAARIASVLRDVRERLSPDGERRWTEHEEVLRRAVESYLTAAPEGLGDAIRAVGDLERRVGDDAPVPFEAAVRALERFVDRTGDDPVPESPGGIAVLDVMQSRGLTFEAVSLLGMQAGSFPRAPREDPFLPDEARAELRRATGRPLAVKREGEAEERQLLVSALGAARGALSVSWQRADVSGRARAASLALREIARWVHGVPDLAGLRRSAVAVPSHPRERILQAARATGLLRRDEAVLVEALAGDADRKAAERVLVLDATLADGIEMLLATEAFDGRLGAYDGRVGRGFRPSRGFSVTSLERLGACPLQFFFRDVLRVRELDEESDPFEVEAREMGSRVHDLLRDLYATLHAEGLLGEAGRALPRARRLLEELWGEHMVRRGVEARFPVLHRIETGRWRRALESFLEDDLERLAAAGVTQAAFETDRSGTILLSGGDRLDVHGRIDRLLRTGEGFLVGEYKTSGKIARRGDLTEMLRGTTLQAPLYSLLTDGAVVEVLGVGPAHDPADGAGDADRVARFPGFGQDEHRAGFLETLAVLASLPGRGAYPLRNDRACRWCAYPSACRKDHVPTRLRHEREDDDFRDLARKNKSRALTLARARGGEEP